MRPVDQAVGFATFANGGVRHAPFFVANVTDNEGAVLLENAGDQGEQVMDPDVANDVTYAIKDVADYSRRSLDGDRPVASKTGTVGSSDDDNSDAWMVGYTPSLSTAVWMGSDTREPIVNARGQIIYGSGLPGEIWQEFMNTVLAGTPEEPLPDSPSIRGDTGEGVPEPEPEPEPTTEAPAPVTSAAPTPTPEPVVDSDGDGVADADDPAPNDASIPNGSNEDEVVDSDGDGVPDAADPAPNDPNVPNPRGVPNLPGQGQGPPDDGTDG
jgi:membrane peptidoglycan carboxypeptidase